MKFNRFVNLQIGIGGAVKNLNSDYKIDFDIELPVGGTFASGTISVTGLNTQDIAMMSTSYQYQMARLMPNTIILTAGYTIGAIPSIIFSGSASEIKPNVDSADKTITFDVTSAFNLSGDDKYKFEAPEATLSMVIANIASKLKLVPEIYTDRPLGAYVFEGNVYMELMQLRQALPDINIYTTATSLVVTENKVPVPGAPILISSMIGGDMIGSPDPTFSGCKVKSLLNPLAKPGGLVNVFSEKIPQTTGTYIAKTIRHTGSTRDSYFYTEYECQRLGYI